MIFLEHTKILPIYNNLKFLLSFQYSNVIMKERDKVFNYKILGKKERKNEKTK